MVIIDVGRFGAFVLDLDGVITRTASIHARAWKQLFDQFLAQRAAQSATPFLPFDPETDYRRYVDGKPRIVGLQSFLASRGINVRLGEPGDQPEQETAHGLAKRKDLYFLKLLAVVGSRCSIRHQHFSGMLGDEVCARPSPHPVTIAPKFCTLRG